jgi:hypothetical protein
MMPGAETPSAWEDHQNSPEYWAKKSHPNLK